MSEISQAMLTLLVFLVLVILSFSLPLWYFFGGIRSSNPDWHKWFPKWALWLTRK